MDGFWLRLIVCRPGTPAPNVSGLALPVRLPATVVRVPNA